jgi:hypothetical protein
VHIGLLVMAFGAVALLLTRYASRRSPPGMP